MGTRKKLLLASLVGLAMVLAFVLGAMPGYDQSRLAASSDSINIQDVLNALLAEEKGAELSVLSNVQAVVVKTPAGEEYVTPEIPLPLTLSEGGQTAVRYVANVEGDVTVWDGSAPNTPGGAGTWNSGDGRAYTDPAVSVAPYPANLDLGTFVTGNVGTRSLQIYGLAGTTLQNGENATILYESATPDPYTIDVVEVAGDITDINGNGIPDDPFLQVEDAEIWTATVQEGEATRTILVVNLDTNTKGGVGQVFSQPADGITVEAPSTAALVAEGAIAANATALLVVQVVDNLADVIDTANGFASTQEWADAVLDLAPVSARSINGPILDVSIVVDEGGTLSELETLPGSLPVTITIEDLEADDNEVLSLFSYPTVLSEGVNGLVASNEPGLQNWTLVTDDAGAGTLSVPVSELSVFVPFLLPGLLITDVTPDEALEGQNVELTLSGTIPVATGLSIAEAEAAYQVTVNGTAATFREGPNGFSIDALVNGSTNAMYLYWSAAITTKATQQADIIISEIVNGQPVELQNFSNALQVTPTYTVQVGAGAGGTAAITTTPNGPNGTFVEGTAVTLTATPNQGFQFVAWQGLDAGENAAAATTTITVTEDRNITATFQVIPTEDTFTLTINRAGNGNGTVTPTTPLEVDAGDTVAITATPNSNSRFTGWTGDIAGVADPSSATTQVTVNADTTITANFALRTPADEPLSVSGLDAAGGLNGEGQVEVWLFGGEVIRINGTGLVAGEDLVSFQVGANAPVTADLYNVAPDGTFGLVVVPPTNATGASPFFLATLRVTRPGEPAPFVLPNVIRYKQYATGADDVTTTAFIIDTPAAGATVDVATDEASANFAELTLPGVDTAADSVYGLVRVAVQDDDKQNTGPVGTAPIGAGIAEAFGGAIPGTTPEATEVDGALDVAFYLYGGAADNSKQNTGSVGAPALLPANELLAFERGANNTGELPTPGDPAGNAGDAATFTYDLGTTAKGLPAGGITNGQVRDGLTVWGVETEYDYVTDTVIAVADPDVAYQSQILAQEARSQGEPEKLAGGDAVPVEELTMRLYTLNGFSLRQGVVAPPDVAAGMRLNTASGTAEDDLAGGVQLTVVSPLGGLAWLERADFVIGGQVVGTTNQFVEIAGVDNGEDEFAVRFNAPASTRAGIASIVLTGRANTTALQTVNLNNVFEYKAAAQGPNLLPFILIGLGLAAALLGLAAGGSSGGGGGGPCFIATAAYGTPLDGNIDVLREVRDNYLLDSTIGTAFVDGYYRVSPAIADAVASSPVLAAVVRVVLVPVIFLGKMALTSPALLVLVALSIGFFFWAKRKAARQS